MIKAKIFCILLLLLASLTAWSKDKSKAAEKDVVEAQEKGAHYEKARVLHHNFSITSGWAHGRMCQLDYMLIELDGERGKIYSLGQPPECNPSKFQGVDLFPENYVTKVYRQGSQMTVLGKDNRERAYRIKNVTLSRGISLPPWDDSTESVPAKPEPEPNAPQPTTTGLPTQAKSPPAPAATRKCPPPPVKGITISGAEPREEYCPQK